MYTYANKSEAEPDHILNNFLHGHLRGRSTIMMHCINFKKYLNYFKSENLCDDCHCFGFINY